MAKYVEVRTNSKIADQHSNGLSRKDIKGVIESLASDPYVAQKIFYRATSNLGCGGQAAIDHDSKTR